MNKPISEYLEDLLYELEDISAFTVDGKDVFM